MAHSGKTPQEFVQCCFSPLVSVLCSSNVDKIVSKNNMNFVELLQPFTKLNNEGQIRDPAGSQCLVRNWKLLIKDVNWKPPQPTEARKFLNNAVSHNYNDKTITLDIGNHKIEIPLSTPWFDAWREAYFDVQFPSDHEFTKHYIACMLVGTTIDGNVTDTFSNLVQQLQQLQNTSPPKLPKWFNNNVLKSYVLLHDISSGEKDKAERAFETLKQIYGAGNCFFLCINSRKVGELDSEHSVSDLWAPHILRHSDTNNEIGSSHNSLPRTPVDARAMSSLPSTVTTVQAEDIPTCPTIFIQADEPHPLSPVDENEVFDNGNSLQTNTFSGSMDSVSSYVNTNVWDSVSAGTNILHGSSLNTNDIEGIKQFMNDYAFKALLPYFERQISQLHDAVANRKGVSRSLLSATKRWFGNTKPGSNTAFNSVIYTPDCPELQLRRLGDLWFMCGQWGRAYDAYHTAKREFSADAAWLCYAGALEMAALSAFMADEPSRKTYAYMEESIVTYLNTCRMTQYAVRATLLSVQCLASGGLHGEAAKQLIRMTSEDSDLRSAMLLEQAALCFVSGTGRHSLCRKYAFHMVLAGHRFSKAGQKRHAYRCYKQAFQIYGNSQWRLAEDHVQFALGRLAVGLRLSQEAARWLAAPLKPHSQQPASQQLALLREYTLAHQQWAESCDEFKKSLPTLPLPLVIDNATAVLSAGIAPLSSPGRTPATSISLQNIDKNTDDDKFWHKMEEMLLQVVKGSVPLIFKPTINLHMETTDNSLNPLVPEGEPIQISVQFYNPLKIPLTLLDVELLWRFTSNAGNNEHCDESISNEPYIASGNTLDFNLISCHKIKSLTLDSNTKKNVIFCLTPLQVGDLCILGVTYKLSNNLEGSEDTGTVILGKQILDIRGPRLKQIKDEITPTYDVDKRLYIKVIPSAPCLQMTFSELKSDLLSGELQKTDIEFRNVGPEEMRNLYLAVSHPECVCIITSDDGPEDFKMLYTEKYQEMSPILDERAIRMARWRACASLRVTNICDHLAGGAFMKATLLIRPTSCHPRFHLLAFYEGASGPHRLLRHTFSFNVTDAVKVVAIPRRSIKLKSDSNTADEILNLAIEVKNTSKQSDTECVNVEILESSLLSKQWKLQNFVSAKNINTCLMSHEKLHLILRAHRITQPLRDEEIDWSSLKINPIHSESKPNINILPFSKFVTEYRSPFDVNNEDIQENIVSKSGLIQSIIVLRWKAKILAKNTERTTVGQHYLWLQCFSNSLSGESEYYFTQNTDSSSLKFGLNDNYSSLTNYTGDLVMYKLQHADTVIHNFKLCKLCLVPVKIYVVNCRRTFIKATISLLNGKANEVGWAGALNNDREVSVSLQPFEVKQVNLQAVCAAPGTYLLGSSFKLTCYFTENSAGIAQSYTNTSLLVIKQSQ